MIEYEYMVIYTHIGGSGRIKITSKDLISSYDQIEELDRVIRASNNLKNLFVTDFKLLRILGTTRYCNCCGQSIESKKNPN